MADINFDCPRCGQNLDAPEDMAGTEVECPSCRETIAVPGGGEEAGLDEASGKGSTMRLDLGDSIAPPPPRKRVFKIKRLP